MTEAPAPTPPPVESAPAPPSTGIDSVDAVLDLVAGLDRRPLEEHIGAFESAHAELRRTLDTPPPTSD